MIKFPFKYMHYGKLCDPSLLANSQMSQGADPVLTLADACAARDKAAEQLKSAAITFGERQKELDILIRIHRRKTGGE